MQKIILTMTVLMAVVSLASCTSRSERRREIEQVALSSSTDATSDSTKYPIYVIMNKKSAFVFHDKQNLVYMMKAANLDSITLLRTTMVYADSSKWSRGYAGDWVIPNSDDYEEYDYTEISGKDTIYHLREKLTFPTSAFKLKPN